MRLRNINKLTGIGLYRLGESEAGKPYTDPQGKLCFIGEDGAGTTNTVIPITTASADDAAGQTRDAATERIDFVIGESQTNHEVKCEGGLVCIYHLSGADVEVTPSECVTAAPPEIDKPFFINSKGQITDTDIAETGSLQGARGVCYAKNGSNFLLMFD